jgi:hypothetical protein
MNTPDISDHGCHSTGCRAFGSYGFGSGGKHRWYCPKHRAEGIAYWQSLRAGPVAPSPGVSAPISPPPASPETGRLL